jgi:formate--tetrahydrofolate ligase
MTDIEIAQANQMEKITQLAQERLGFSENDLEPFGHYKAKVTWEALQRLVSDKKAGSASSSGHLILVTAISPTPAGEGKTTTTVGLGDGLTRIGKKSIICLREPSLGPVFGMKGGAAGGGYAQVVPMEDINLHFTGDFSAIQNAHNLLAALIDNHIHQGNSLGFDVRKKIWPRVLDMNDRALREIVIGLGGSANGFPRSSQFDIVVASEVMAILCLAQDLTDLKKRLGEITCGHSLQGQLIKAKELRAEGAMAALLKEALRPNLVQSLEKTPAFVHGGPFANIAHGCNSVLATKLSLALADYVVTEAGFGADLGAEKFINIKCRKAGLYPKVAVLVATLKALKYHGGVEAKLAKNANHLALQKGLENLGRHLANIQSVYGIPCVVSLNHFVGDPEEEIAVVANYCKSRDAQLVVAKHWSSGGAGAEELARAVVQLSESPHSPHKVTLTYEDTDSLPLKIEKIARQIYGANSVVLEPKAQAQLDLYKDLGYSHFPVCIAKTQYSLTDDSKKRGLPGAHQLHVREVRLCTGAEFIVAVCGDIMTMPGLPKNPAAELIDIDASGRILGLF